MCLGLVSGLNRDIESFLNAGRRCFIQILTVPMHHHPPGVRCLPVLPDIDALPCPQGQFPGV